MRIRRKADYALRAAVEIARSGPVPVSAGEVADRLGLPRRFVEQQVTELAHAGVVDCRRGAGGGCTLARPATELTAADVLGAIVGPLLEVPESGGAVGGLWGRLALAVDEVLLGTTLADLVREQAALEAGGDYAI